MATIEIPHNPQLTLRKLLEMFEDAFDGEYEVYQADPADHYFIVRQSKLSGVAVAMVHRDGRTLARFQRYTPSDALRGVIMKYLRNAFGSKVCSDVGAFLLSLRHQPL